MVCCSTGATHEQHPRHSDPGDGKLGQDFVLMGFNCGPLKTGAGQNKKISAPEGLLKKIFLKEENIFRHQC